MAIKEIYRNNDDSFRVGVFEDGAPSNYRFALYFKSGEDDFGQNIWDTIMEVPTSIINKKEVVDSIQLTFNGRCTKDKLMEYNAGILALAEGFSAIKDFLKKDGGV